LGSPVWFDSTQLEVRPLYLSVTFRTDKRKASAMGAVSSAVKGGESLVLASPERGALANINGKI